MVEEKEKAGEAMADTKNLKKRGNVWWFKKTYKAVPHYFTLETRDLREAQRRRDDYLNDLRSGKWGNQRVRSFNELVDLFIDDHFPVIKPNTRKRYVSNIKALLEKFDGVSMREIDDETLLEFERTRRKSGVSNMTIVSDLRCLSSMYHSANDAKWTKENPVKEFLANRSKRALKTPGKRERFLTHAEENVVIKNATPKPEQAVCFAIDTGLREDEQFSLLKTDIDLELRRVRVRPEVAKSSKARFVPLLDRSLALAEAILKEDLPSPYLFVTKHGGRYTEDSHTMYSALQRACRRGKIQEHVQWHDLRRTFACRMLHDYELEMHELSVLLGHSSVTVTEQHYGFLNTRHVHAKIDRIQRRQSEIEKLKKLIKDGTKMGTPEFSSEEMRAISKDSTI